MKEWPKIIRELMREQGFTGLKLARHAGMGRNTVNKYLRGELLNIRIGQLEAILNVLGHELDALPINTEAQSCRRLDPAFAVAGKSSKPASVAPAKSSGTKNAKPASISEGHQPANVATTANGTKRVRIISRRTPSANVDAAQPSSTISSPTKATGGCSGTDLTGSPCASPATQAASSAKSGAHAPSPGGSAQLSSHAGGPAGGHARNIQKSKNEARP